MNLTVILPVYNCKNCIGPLIAEIREVCDPNWQFIFVDDCSNDGSVDELRRSIAMLGSRARAFSTTKNEGSHRAILAAASHVCTDLVAFMAADGQDDPSQLHQMLSRMKSDSCDVVFTSSIANDISGRVFHLLMNKAGKIVPKAPKMRWHMALTLTRKIVEASKNSKAHLYYNLVLGGKMVAIEANRRPRLAGVSQWTTLKKVRFALIWLLESIVPKRRTRALPPMMRPL